MMVPEEDVVLNDYRQKHGDHFASPQHVSQSKFKEFFGSRDLGLKIHIPAAGSNAAVEAAIKEEAAAQRKRCQKMRNGSLSSASES